MKIGILTFHYTYNYGATLQAFALQEFLKGLGHEVEVLDYRPRRDLVPNSVSLEKQKKISGQKRFYRLVSGTFRRIFKTIGSTSPWTLIPRALGIARKHRKFEVFMVNRLNLSRRFPDFGVSAKGYDAVVFGSDQVWHPIITRGLTAYFGNIGDAENCLKIAYAASAGGGTEQLGESPVLLELLKDFDAISVREQNLAELLEQKLEREVRVTLDPTLLVDKTVWDKIAVTPKRKRKYVLVYKAAHVPAMFRIARELAEQIDADVVSLPAHGMGTSDHIPWGAGLEEFVGWFKNATCVVTTSFHGTAFSLIYEKPLYYVSKGEGEAAENRIRHILRELGLLDRIVLEDAHPKFSEIDYNNSKARFETLRSASRGFLENALAKH